jgi:ketosteroid isomerase-like protein
MVELAVALWLMADQPDDAVTATRELTQIERQLATAWTTGDCDAWGAFLAPEWSVTHITGAVITKSQALQMCQVPQARLETLTSDELSVRVFGDAAVVTGRTIATTGGANPETVRLRFTDVFIRRGGRWQIVASHATRLTP